MFIRRYTLCAFAVLGLNLHQAGAQSLTSASNFVAVTPCRVVDTRNPIGTFGGPYMAANTTRSFPIPSGPCSGIPTTAAAYSLNVTVVPHGPLYVLAIYPTGVSLPTLVSTLNAFEGQVVANAAIVPAGNDGQGSVTVAVSNDTDVVIDINGYFALVSNSNGNTAVGSGALSQNQGGDNTAVGSNAMFSNTTGGFNTAVGINALYSNTTGNNNTALGQEALEMNTTGIQNAAFGDGSLAQNTTGNQNTAFGSQALSASTGSMNTAIGAAAGLYLTSGSSNVLIGVNAGTNYSNGESNNIIIGTCASPASASAPCGAANESNVMRIGDPNTQTSTYIAGIANSTAITGATVVVNSNGQLGVQSSSIRFKEDVHDIAESSDALMQLRPVQFRYKQTDAEGKKPLQYGLIAEEVAKVYPELVVRGPDGQVNAVQYQELPALLLNELQKQHKAMEQLVEDNQRLRERIETLERQPPLPAQQTAK